jgi:hypothetical protein
MLDVVSASDSSSKLYPITAHPPAAFVTRISCRYCNPNAERVPCHVPAISCAPSGAATQIAAAMINKRMHRSLIESNITTARMERDG